MEKVLDMNASKIEQLMGGQRSLDMALIAYQRKVSEMFAMREEDYDNKLVTLYNARSDQDHRIGSIKLIQQDLAAEVQAAIDRMEKITLDQKDLSRDIKFMRKSKVDEKEFLKMV